MKNKLFAIVLTLVLSLPVSVWAVDDTVEVADPAPVVNTLDEGAIQTKSEPSPYKKPTSKRKLAKKFLAAMGGVAISSLALYFLLTVYNKVRDGYTCQTKIVDGEPSLETPNDLDSAVKTFLDKTNWG